MRRRGGEPDLPPGPARELVDLFRRLRQGRRLSGGQVAVATGLSRSHVSEVLRGVKAPSPQAAARIAHALGATGDQERKAYQLAEQLGELNRYHRARGTQPAGTRRAVPRAPAAAEPAGRQNHGTQSPEPGAEQIQPLVDVFPVTIGHYTDPDLPELDAETQAGRLVDLLAPFGGRYRQWRHPAQGRGADAVQHRLREWSHPLAPTAGSGELGASAVKPPPGSSVLYWVGHDWSDGTRAALAHAESPAVVGASGLEPQQLAQAIRARQVAAGAGREAGGRDGWALVVLETGHAAQVADAVMAALHGPDAPARLLVVAVPGGTGPPGGFIEVLANLLADTYRAERRILLRDLAAQLERLLGPGNVHQRALGEAALVRTHPPVASWMSAPVDTIRHLEEVLADLAPDERGHFLVKAQGAEHGELSWFFEGREDELAQISTWLQRASSGMLVVTGRAGSGKSALMGTVLVRSLPALRDALARRGLVTTPASGTEAPPESVFDAVIHLSGLDLARATSRVAAAAGIGSLPSGRDREAGVASDLDFLAGELAGRTQRFTVLADALDESLDPLDIARSLLARIAVVPMVRVIVGTRASTSEAPDTAADDENLLDALGTGYHVIWVGQDKQAIGRYVTGRLRAARDVGVAGRAVPHMAGVSDRDIQRAAGEVAGRGQEFLFARLAVYELIADPRLLTPQMARSRGQLLGGTHRDLFGRALYRLASHDDRYPVLMRALSLARGRGIPEADGIWAAIAAALAPGPASWPVIDAGSGTAAAWAAAISGLLEQAAAYITVDTSAEPGRSAAGPGTVYRLAHRTFAEYFGEHQPTRPDSSDPISLAASALLLAAAQAARAGPGRLPDYMSGHLSGHAAEAGLWDELAALPRVLDNLDPGAVTTDAIRSLFGRHTIPAPIAGIIGGRDTLARASPADRPGLRQLATTVHSPRHVIAEPTTGWGIAAAQVGHSTVHVRLSGHAGTVSNVRSVTLAGERVVLASCGDDGTIRLWDPVTATPVGVPMSGHDGTVEALCALPAAGGRTLLASGGSDGTVRLWDPATGQPVRPPLVGHTGPVWSLCLVPARPGRPPGLASAGDDGTVRLWDPAAGQPVGPPLVGHTGPVYGVCMMPGRRRTLASAGSDGTVRMWDPAAGQPVGPPLVGHTGPVLGMCAVPARPGRPAVLASAGEDGTVRLWDVATGRPSGPSLAGHTGPVFCVCAVAARPGRPAVLASAGEDGTVRLWDVATGRPSGPSLAGHTGPVFCVCAVAARPGQPAVLASAGRDGTVRLWDVTTDQPADPPLTDHTGPLWGICAVPGRPAVLASAGRDGTVRLWDVATGQPAGPPLTGHTGPVWSVCAPGRPSALASAGRDGTVRLWDVATGHPAGPPLAGHTGPVFDICAVPGRSAMLASAGRDGSVRLWDVATGHPAGPPLTGHTGLIHSVCAVPGRPAMVASAGGDGTVRLWDVATGHPASPPLTGHTGPVFDICAVPGRSAMLASAGGDGTVRLWDLATGRPVRPPLAGHTGTVFGVCATPGRGPSQPPALASAGNDGTVRLWDLVTGQPARPPLVGHSGPVHRVCVVPGRSAVLASAGGDGTVRLWDAWTGRTVGEPLIRSPQAVSALAPCDAAIGDCLTAHGDGAVRTWTSATATLHAVAAPPDVSAIAALNSSLLTGDSYGHVRLSHPRAGEPGPPVQVDTRAVLALCSLPARPPTARAAAAGGSGTIAIITVSSTGQLEPGPILRGHSGPIRALCPIPSGDGRVLLAAAGNDAAVSVWDLTDIDTRPPDAGTPMAPMVGPLTGHYGWIWSLAVIPARDGSPLRLASAGADQIIRLWDPVSGHALGRPLAGHTGQVRTVITATSDDGRMLLVSGGHDGTIRLWDPLTGTPGAVIPLGIPAHALLQHRADPASLERTGGGATITVGLRTGILTLDLHSDLFQKPGS